MKKKVLVTLWSLLLISGLTLTGVVAPAFAGGTGVITVTSFPARTLAPAFSLTSTYSPANTGNGPGFSINLQRLLLPATCTTTATTTWADCGITSIKINGTAVSAATTVARVTTTKLYFTLPAAQNGITTSEISFGPAMLTVSNAVGNASAVFDFMDNSVSTPFTVTASPNYSVNFDANGGSGTMASQSTNAVTALSTNSYTRPGYTFAGWATSQADANAGTVAYVDGDNYDFLASTTLYAIWTANSNGGSGGGSGGASASTSTDLANTGFAMLPFLGTGSALVLLGGVIVMLTKPRRVRSRSRI